MNNIPEQAACAAELQVLSADCAGTAGRVLSRRSAQGGVGTVFSLPQGDGLTAAVLQSTTAVSRSAAAILHHLHI